MPRLFGFDNQARTRVREAEMQVAREAVSRVRVGGQSQAEAAEWMNSVGSRGTKGGEWNSMTLGRFFDNPAIAGLEEDPETGELRETGLPALITREEFLDLRRRPSRPGSVRSGEPRADDYPYLFTDGFAVCDECSEGLTGSRTTVGTPSYRCILSGCGKVRITASLLEDHTGEHVLAELLRPGTREAVEAAKAQLEAEAAQLRAQVAKLERSRAELGDSYGQLSRDTLVAAGRRVEIDLKAARTRLRFVEQATNTTPLGGVEDLAQWWNHAPPKAKRGLAILLLEQIRVGPAQERGVRTIEDDRVKLLWRAAA